MIRKASLFVGMLALMAGFFATPVAAACDTHFLTFPAWYDGLTKDNSCEIEAPGQGNTDLRDFIIRIIFNITEIILQIVAYASLVFVIVGGFKYMIATGSSDGMASAKKTIMNALIGLVISIFSVGIVNAAAGLF